MTVLHADFETFSTVDLKTVGLDNYARHPTTDAWCMSFRFDKEPVQRWKRGEPLPIDVALHVSSGGQVVAHNASFELAIWNLIMAVRYGWPELKIEQVRCTMAMGYAMSLPGKLEQMAPALGITARKDMAGSRLMMQMCRPRDIKPDGTVIWWDEPEKIERLGAYCDQDVVVESGMDERLMPLSPDEQALWVLDQKINQRGVYIDRDAVAKAIAIVEAEQKRLDDQMRKVTGNFVGFCTEVARLKKWIATRGIDVDGLAKMDVMDLLALDTLPEDVRAALLLRQEAGKSSTAKLRAMVTAASTQDDRLRGMMQYHGAGTGRWAGRRVQLQNIPRPKLGSAEIERAIDVIKRTADPKHAAQYLDVLFAPPLDVISWSLRGMICAAPGNDLLAADFANIEGRGLAWLAGDEKKLDVFRAFDDGSGLDVYKLMAATVLTKPVGEIDKDQRQTYGKVPELACGYQGGVGAFQKMAKTYQVKVSDEIADFAKTQWRAAHPKIVQYWYDLEAAAIEAVLNPGRVTMAGAPGRQVKFRVKGSFLWCLLPSGRALCYPYPKLKQKMTPWGEEKDQVHYMTVDGTTNKWEETHTYGGKLAENVTQAICRDLLVAAIRQAEAAGYPVVLHVHDEVVSEVPKAFGSLEEYERVCSTMPAWAAGLPVVAEGWRGERYRK
jgi:DNA polymerase